VHAGKHGDTAMGEVEVIKALEGGQVDAGLVSDLMWSRAVVIYIPLFRNFCSEYIGLFFKNIGTNTQTSLQNAQASF